MATADAVIEARARRAYERGRWQLGLERVLVVAPMGLLSYLVCGRPTATVIGAVLLASLVGWCEWCGQTVGRGARIGLWAGLGPLLLPVAVQTSGRVCDSSLCLFYPAACLAGGVAAGALLILACLRRDVGSRGMVSAGLVAALAGTLGCLLGGMNGLIALVAGLGLGAAPVLAWRRA